MVEIKFNLPDLGEGLVDATVLEWLVSDGEFIERGQPFVEVETTKSTIELPSPQSGKVLRLHARQGDVVNVGQPLVSFEVDEDQAGIVGTVPAENKPSKRITLKLPDDD